MTAATGVMRLGCTTCQRGVGMTAVAGSTGYGDDAGMAWRGCMRSFPVRGMTRRAVAAGRKVLTYS